MFKNLSVFSLPEPWTMTAGSLESLLVSKPLARVSETTVLNTGFVPAAPDGRFVLDFERHLMFVVGVEEKKIPASALKRKVQLAAKELEDQQGFAPGRKQMRDLKDRIAFEMLPGIPAKYSEIRVWIDGASQRVIMDCGSATRAEMAGTVVRGVLESFSIVPVDMTKSPSEVMRRWILNNYVNKSLALGEGVTLVGDGIVKRKVTYKAFDVATEDKIKAHLNEGMSVSAVELSYKDRLVFSLTGKGEVKSIKYLDPSDEPEQRDGDEYTGSFILMASTCSALLDAVLPEFAEGAD